MKDPRITELLEKSKKIVKESKRLNEKVQQNLEELEKLIRAAK